MLLVVSGQTVAWDMIWQVDSFSLWVCVSCHVWRDMLVYWYSSYWISPHFLQFLHQIFFFHFRETGGGGGYIQSWLWCFLLNRVQKFTCACFCLFGAIAGVPFPTRSTSSCEEGTGAAQPAAAALRASGQAVLFTYVRFEDLCPPTGPSLTERDTVATAPHVYRHTQANQRWSWDEAWHAWEDLHFCNDSCPCWDFLRLREQAPAFLPALEDQGSYGSDNLQRFRKPFPFA